MSRICKTCGSLFKATGNEQECPTCKEGFNDIMSIIKGRDSKETVKDRSASYYTRAITQDDYMSGVWSGV